MLEREHRRGGWGGRKHVIGEPAVQTKAVGGSAVGRGELILHLSEGQLSWALRASLYPDTFVPTQVSTGQVPMILFSSSLFFILCKFQPKELRLLSTADKDTGSLVYIPVPVSVSHTLTIFWVIPSAEGSISSMDTCGFFTSCIPGFRDLISNL